MITAGDFRNGVTFEMDGNVVSIIEFQHVKPGKGAALLLHSADSSLCVRAGTCNVRSLFHMSGPGWAQQAFV